MRLRRTNLKGSGRTAVYHCMSRTVAGELLFKDREKEVLRKMLWQVAEFCGVEILTYCVMSNHFHVLLRVPSEGTLSDVELMRRYKVLYPKPTKFQSASVRVLEAQLSAGGIEADEIRHKLLARMGDISDFMKTVKQRFSVWYNRNHNRYGTLWADRFKSVLVEGSGHPLQTMAAYIDLNPVRAGLVDDPKDYRFCGYAEAVAGDKFSKQGLVRLWGDHSGEDAVLRRAPSEMSQDLSADKALRAHRMLLFGKGASPWTHRGKVINHKKALQVLEQEQGKLPACVILRCRVRYFTDGGILGSAEFVRGFVDAWQHGRGRKYPPKVNALKGADWGDISVIQGLRQQVFG
jgi:putative transposase